MSERTVTEVMREMRDADQWLELARAEYRRSVPVVRWRNVGAWVELRFRPSLGVRTPWGNLIVKRWSDRLFSERYGYSRALHLGPLCVTWVRLRKYPSMKTRETQATSTASPSQQEGNQG